MRSGVASLSGLVLLLLRGAQAAPQVIARDTGIISVLEDIHAHTPITWHEVVNSDGSKSNVTDIDTAVWDDAVAQLVPRLLTADKRQERSCYGSGSWAKQKVLYDGVNDACNSLSKYLFFSCLSC